MHPANGRTLIISAKLICFLTAFIVNLPDKLPFDHRILQKLTAAQAVIFMRARYYSKPIWSGLAACPAVMHDLVPESVRLKLVGLQFESMRVN
jgi:hypothetical protein